MSLKLVKRSGLSLLHRGGFLSLARAIQRRRVLILAYHGVLAGADDGYDYLNYNFMAAEAFEQQVRFVATHYRVLPLDTVVDAYLQRRPLPDRAAVFTFDDGFENNYTVVFPILRRYKVPFTVFLTSGMIDTPGAQLWSERVSRAVYLTERRDAPTLALAGTEVAVKLHSAAERELASRRIVDVVKRLRPGDRDLAVLDVESAFGRPGLSDVEGERYRFLSWSQVREMADAGVEFGSHTVSHPIVSTLDDDALQWELQTSKRTIEQQTGVECRSFAFPNGSRNDFGPRDQAALRAAGYRSALALCGGLNGPRADIFALERVNVGREFEPAMFEAAVSGVLGGAGKARALLMRAPAIVRDRLTTRELGHAAP